jgi:hypothetical protein
VKFPASRHQSRSWERGPSSPVATPQDQYTSFGLNNSARAIDSVMSRKTRNLLLAAIVPIAVVFIGVKLLLPSTTQGDASIPPRHEEKAVPSPSPESAAEPTPAPEDAGGNTKSYAIPVPELAGLPSDAPPGTRLELWVAWDPPITKTPKIQRLLKDVTLEKIVPPVVPEAPATAILSLPDRAVPDLLYGDKYGSLSVTMFR